MKKVLFTATVVKKHIMEFHVPFLKMFKDMGWETAVAATNDYDDPGDCNIPYCDTYYDIHFERSPFNRSNVKTYKELKKIIKDGQFDVIHCHTPVGAAITRMAAISARKSGTKVIYTAHGFHFYKGAPLKNWLLFYPIEWFLSFFTDILITINEEDYSFAQKHMHAKQIEYVPGVGVDTTRFSPNTKLRTEKRYELGITEDNFVLLTVAELIPRKNYQLMLRTLAQIKACPEFEKIKYLICGDGVLLEELKREVHLQGLQDCVLFLGYQRNIEAMCNCSDAFVFMSHQEGLPVALMEAMACGLPVIGSKIRGNVDLIVDGENGLLRDSNPESVASAILKLYADPQYRRKLGCAAKETMTHYDSCVIQEKMAKIYFKS